MKKKSKFTFKQADHGYDVVLKGKKIGQIKPMQEATGRHCFFLGCDTRKSPRTYRGKIKAAEALEAMSKLIANYRKKKSSLEMLIINCWDDRPRASDQW